jgi:hypothetical protein
MTGIGVIGDETTSLGLMDRFRGEPRPYFWRSRFPLCLDAPSHSAVPY